MADNKATDAILAILREAKEAGVGGITRTGLLKYLYLLDLFVARDMGGQTFTGSAWRFHHFGPYADDLAAELDRLCNTPSVECLQGGGQSKDYSIYKLGAYGTSPTLEELGLSFDVRSNLSGALRQFSGDLTALLNYVYFHTEPMAHAKPGDVLSFQGASKADYKRDVRPISVPVRDPQRLERMKTLLQRLGENWERRAKEQAGQLTAPIRDQHYASTLTDDDLSPAAGSYKGRLLFEGDA